MTGETKSLLPLELKTSGGVFCVNCVVAAAIVAVFIFWGRKKPASQVVASPQAHSHAEKVQAIFTDPEVFKATLIDMVRSVNAFDEEQEKHHNKLFEPDGPWGKILAEKDSVLREGLGEDYKSNPKLAVLEIELLYNLGKLDLIRNYEGFQQMRAGNMHYKP